MSNPVASLSDTAAGSDLRTSSTPWVIWSVRAGQEEVSPISWLNLRTLVDIDQDVVNVWTWAEGSTTGTPGGMSLKHSIEPPAMVTSYKARYPFLVAEAFLEQKLLVFNIETGQLVRQYDVSNDERVSN